MSADALKLGFSSNFRYERIAKKGSQSFSVGAFSFPSFTIQHGLGYVPYVKFYYSFDGNRIFPLFSGPSSYNIAGNQFQINNVVVRSNTITIDLENYDSVAHTIIIYYRIYAEPQI